jgi:hypothetical protein
MYIIWRNWTILITPLYIRLNLIYAQMQNLFFYVFWFTTVKFYANSIHDYLFKAQDKSYW